jgi:hypothetical protein
MGLVVTGQHVVSKKRVADHGEVYTRSREVDAMLDLVKAETERIDSRFLEPACGNANFLAEVLRRKLRVVESRYSRSPLEYERYMLRAVSSLYGIDILEENVRQCRDRHMTGSSGSATRPARPASAWTTSTKASRLQVVTD